MRRHSATAVQSTPRLFQSIFLLSGVIASIALAPLLRGQDAMKPPAGKEAAEIPHPFFTHMGLPEGVGVYSLRVLGLAARADGKNDGDFAFHFETGITSRIGLHVRNDRFRNSDRTEVMLQFAAFVSEDGMSGFAPVIEFAFPTKSGVSRINTQVGFTSTLGGERYAFNQALHYDPREDAGDGSLALVLKASRYLFPAIEILGEGGKGQSSVVSGLFGLKVRVNELITLGVAYQVPLTDRKEFSSQLAFGSDFGWTRK